MKTKATAFLLWLACGSLFFSCSSDDGGTPPEPEPEVPAEVALTSFGFYKEDNDQLIADYVVEDISAETTEVAIALPAQVDVTSLVARFTVGENDKVSVSGTAQVSGETGNDFSAPLEFLVNEGDTNKIYTIKITKMASAVWGDMPAFTDAGVYEMTLGVSPLTSEPYVGYIIDAEDADNRKSNMISYQEGAWGAIGAADFSGSRAKYMDLGFGQDGTPMVAYFDYEESVYGFGTAMGYNGSSWGNLGTAGFTDVNVNDIAITSDGAGNVFSFFIAASDSGSYIKRSVYAKVFDGTSWSDMPITGREGMARTLRAVTVNGAVYLAVLDYGENQHVSVYKYQDGAWTTLADKMKDAEDNTIYYYDISLAVDLDDNVYLAYAEDAGPDTEYALKVKKYSAESQSWATMGNTIATAEVRSFAVGVDPYGNALFLYKNDAKNPVAVPFDNEINNWGEAVVLSSVEAENDLNMEYAPNGVAYAAYTVDGQLYVHKYDSPDNE